MRTPTWIVPTLALTALLGLGAGPAHALQLLSNFGFDTGNEDWASCCGSTGTVGWDATNDAYESALSGSARLTHTDVFDGMSETSLFLTRCLEGPAITPGNQLVFGMKVRFEPGEATTGEAYMAVEFRGDPGCAGSSSNGASKGVSTADTPRGTWVWIRRTAAMPVTVPEGAQSLKIFAVVTKSSNGTLTANVDGIYVATADTPICDGLPATIVGDGTDEIVNGTDASDVIVTRGGNDTVDAKEGNDHVCGGPGDDTIYGADGDDRVFGEGGQDNLWGGGDDDLLYGAGNNDKLYGGDGDDKLRGGTGVDTCYGDGGTNVKKKCELPFFVPL